MTNNNLFYNKSTINLLSVLFHNLWPNCKMDIMTFNSQHQLCIKKRQIISRFFGFGSSFFIIFTQLRSRGAYFHKFDVLLTGHRYNDTLSSLKEFALLQLCH
mmetsp:Transcript_18736/g.31255  ORF Transcript_18736/g.31255 Transcript_18736/m.31255 type:complete len:102 (-) Transcript_18736:199-504(-)